VAAAVRGALEEALEVAPDDVEARFAGVAAARQSQFEAPTPYSGVQREAPK